MKRWTIERAWAWCICAQYKRDRFDVSHESGGCGADINTIAINADTKLRMVFFVGFMSAAFEIIKKLFINMNYLFAMLCKRIRMLDWVFIQLRSEQQQHQHYWTHTEMCSVCMSAITTSLPHPQLPNNILECTSSGVDCRAYEMKQWNNRHLLRARVGAALNSYSVLFRQPTDPT